MTRLAWLLVAMLLPTALGLLVIGTARGARAWQDRPSRASTTGPSLQQVAADLRRLHATLAAMEERPPHPGRGVRLTACRRAYVDALLAACRLLELPVRLDPARATTVDLLRVEATLREHGLDVRPAPVG